jgi:hypothetical protein
MRRVHFTVLIAVVLLSIPVTAGADCASATRAAGGFGDAFVEYVKSSAAGIQRLPFAIPEKAYHDFRRDHLAEILATGVREGDDESCFRNALMSAPAVQSKVNEIVAANGGAAPMYSVACPAGPSFNPAVIDGTRLSAAGVQAQFPAPRGWTMQLGLPSTPSPLQQAYLESYLGSDAPRLSCIYAGGYVFTRGGVSCRPNSAGGFQPVGSGNSMCTTGKCVADCAFEY